VKWDLAKTGKAANNSTARSCFTCDWASSAVNEVLTLSVTRNEK
jgi:hypothetical protein